MLGDTTVGKAKLVACLKTDEYDDISRSAIGVDFVIATTADGRFRLQVWDTAGQERFRAFTSAYYKSKSAHVLVYIFSVDSR